MQPHAHLHASAQVGFSDFEAARTRALARAAGRAAPSAADPATADASPMAAVIRSKGFAWMQSAHWKRFLWAHAGHHVEARDVSPSGACRPLPAGRSPPATQVAPHAPWWDAVIRDEWPAGAADVAAIEADMAAEFGDRRQEIVFIGVQMDEQRITAPRGGGLPPRKSCA